MNYDRLLLVFLVALASIPVHAQTDVSFITGNWCGILPQSVVVAPACWKGGNTSALEARMRAESGKAFSGTLLNGNIASGKGCSDDCLDRCQVQGQVEGKNLTMKLTCASGNPCTLTGTLNSTFSEMNLTATCTEGVFRFRLTKPVSIRDVSVNSGIADNTILTTGVQWIDYNNDRRLDLYLVGRSGNAMFKNIGGGKFTDVTSQTRTGNNGKDARGASWADIDNDGDLDVFIANASLAPTLLLNQKGVFKDISSNISSAWRAVVGTVGTTRGAIWVDINNDKQTDLYMINEGAPNALFKQVGLRFTDIGASSGLAFSGNGRSAVATDFNGDGYQDLFLVNFRQSNKLYINQKNETFQDMAKAAWLAFTGGSVQAALADYDGDKDLDIFLVNNEGPSILYRRTGNVKYQAKTPGILKGPKKAIAAVFADIDADGDDDLVIAQTEGGNFLFDNQGKGKWAQVKGIDLNRPDNPTGVSVGDYNNDGLPDIAIGDGDDSKDNGDSLYSNDGGGANNTVTLQLQGTKSNRAALGAVAVVEVGFIFRVKVVSSGNGQNQESLPLEFGIGPAIKVDSIQISWPGGTIQNITKINNADILANKTYKILEP